MKKNNQVITSLLIGLSFVCCAQQGALDIGFNPQTAPGTFVKSIALQSDGKSIIGGNFAKGIARLNSDGTIDNSFNVGVGTDSTVNAIAVQLDGKIIIAGSFKSYNGTSLNRIARLNTDGSLDNSFNIGTGISGSNCSFNAPASVNALCLQTDGKIIVGGCFSTYNVTSINNLVRLNTDGTLDNTFATGTGPDNFVLSIALQSDGKIIIGGRFFSFNSAGKPFLARLNSGGSIDNVFSNNISLGPTNITQVNTIAVQNNGKVIIGGNFNHCNGVTPVKRICRLNADGTLDNTFVLNQIIPSLYYEVHACALQNDGKIIVGGQVTLPSNDTINRIVRLNTDGTIDNSFVTGKGINGGDVYTLAIQTDGKIIAGGDFKAYNGTLRNGIARLNGENILGIQSTDSQHRMVEISPNPSRGLISLKFHQTGQHVGVKVIDVIGRVIFQKDFCPQGSIECIDITDRNAGIYYMVIDYNGKPYAQKIILE